MHKTIRDHKNLRANFDSLPEDLHPLISRDLVHFYGLNSQDFSILVAHNISIVSPIGFSSFILINPGVVFDGEIIGPKTIRITGISGQTASFAETSLFNHLYSQLATDFYMKGRTVFATFLDDDLPQTL